jgi:hypothetical protein
MVIIATRTSESRFPQSNDPLLTTHRYRERNNHTDELHRSSLPAEEQEISVEGMRAGGGGRLQPLGCFEEDVCSCVALESLLILIYSQTVSCIIERLLFNE